MNVIDLLLYELDHTYNQDDWYSPIKLALTNLTAEQARWKFDNESLNSIWEIAAHLLYYKERLLFQLQGKKLEYTPSNNQDTFLFEGSSQADWDAFVNRMYQVNQRLYEQIQSLSETDLEKDKSKVPLWKHINGVIRHDAHHAGQIIMIRKLQGSWPVHQEEKNKVKR